MSKRTNQKATRIGVIAASFAALVLPGCAFPTAPERPALAQVAPLPERWTFADADGSAVDLGSYWLLLDDPLIEEYVASAAADNLDIAQSAARLRAAAAGLREARAARYPSISAGGSVAQEFGDLSRDDPLISLDGSLSWELDLFGRIGGSIDAAEADLLAAGYNLADLQRLIGANVAIQVITARSIAAQLDIARASLVNQDDNLQIAQWRNQAGLVSSLDVEQARTQRAQTAASIPRLESDLAATANSISTLIGEAPGAVYRSLQASPAAVPQVPIDVAVAAPADILRMRPDVSAAEARLASDLERVGIARTQLYPLARLTGSVGTSSVGLDNLFDIISGNVIASLSQLIFDAGRTRAQIEAADAIADGSLAAWQQSILVALEEVESASIDLAANQERVEALIEASAGAENAAILGRSQYEAGLIDFQVLLNVESALLSARTSQISAEAARAIAFVQLARAMGGGWGMAPPTLIDERDAE